MSDELTQSEFSKLGAEARTSKLSPERRREIAKKAGLANLAKNGIDHFRQMQKKSLEARKKKVTIPHLVNDEGEVVIVADTLDQPIGKTSLLDKILGKKPKTGSS